MKKEIRSLLVGTLTAFAILPASVLFARFRAQQRQVVRVLIAPLETAPQNPRRMWTWTGSRAQSVFTAFQIENNDKRVASVSALDTSWLRLEATRADGTRIKRFFHLRAGQMGFPYGVEDGNRHNLTPESIAYFHDLLARTPPSAK